MAMCVTSSEPGLALLAERLMIQSRNFAFLAVHDEQLARYGGLAEHYFALEPRDCVVKLRQMAEYMAQLAAARMGFEVSHEDSFLDVLRMMQRSGSLPSEAADIFHFIRKQGNSAVHQHDLEITHGQALHFLKISRALATWFHRLVSGRANFNPGPFVPPEDPQAADHALRDELEELRFVLSDNQEALVAARQAEIERQAEIKTVLNDLDSVNEEKDIYRALAQKSLKNNKMKKILILLTVLILMVGMAFTASAQYSNTFTASTITVSSAADTIYFTPTKDFKYAGIVGGYVKCDSISGATGGTITYQIRSEDGTTWHPIGTDTFNGAGVTYYDQQGVCYANGYRIMIQVPSSTQSTTFTATIEYKRTNK